MMGREELVGSNETLLLDSSDSEQIASLLSLSFNVCKMGTVTVSLTLGTE